LLALAREVRPLRCDAPARGIPLALVTDEGRGMDARGKMQNGGDRPLTVRRSLPPPPPPSAPATSAERPINARVWTPRVICSFLPRPFARAHDSSRGSVLSSFLFFSSVISTCYFFSADYAGKIGHSRGNCRTGAARGDESGTETATEQIDRKLYVA